MIEIQAKLKCDRCLGVFTYCWFKARLTRGQIAEIRSSARERGWRRLRPGPEDAVGDYCPRCLKKLRGKGVAR